MITEQITIDVVKILTIFVASGSIAYVLLTLHNIKKKVDKLSQKISLN